jgi:replicative DNA helicase
VKGQPAVVGGPKKALKTSLLVDLAISLGTGTSFLGEFRVEQPVRVGLMCGESGEATLQETGRRVAAARNLDPCEALGNVFWEFKLPQLALLVHLAALVEALKEVRAEVLLLDPLYLPLLAGADPGGPQASNLYQMGPLLLGVTGACLKIGCTPVLAHHFKLGRGDPYKEPQLEGLAYSGVQEFVRQWILVGRQEAYQPGTGSHRLWLSVGGSAGHSGLWSLEIEEGTVGENFGGRAWEVKVHTAGESRQAEQARRQAEQREQQEARDQADERVVMAAIDRLDPNGQGVGIGVMRTELRLSRERFDRAVRRLRERQVIEPATVEVETNNGAKRPSPGLRRKRETA